MGSKTEWLIAEEKLKLKEGIRKIDAGEVDDFFGESGRILVKHLLPGVRKEMLSRILKIENRRNNRINLFLSEAYKNAKQKLQEDIKKQEEYMMRPYRRDVNQIENKPMRGIFPMIEKATIDPPWRQKKLNDFVRDLNDVCEKHKMPGVGTTAFDNMMDNYFNFRKK